MKLPWSSTMIKNNLTVLQPKHQDKLPRMKVMIIFLVSVNYGTSGMNSTETVYSLPDQPSNLCSDFLFNQEEKKRSMFLISTH